MDDETDDSSEMSSFLHVSILTGTTPTECKIRKSFPVQLMVWQGIAHAQDGQILPAFITKYETSKLNDESLSNV